jgi:hypothetical protein
MPPPRSTTTPRSDVKSLLEALKQDILDDQTERISKEELQDLAIKELQEKIEKLTVLPNEHVTSWRILLTLTQSVGADTIARRMLVGGMLTLAFLLVICASVVVNGHPDLLVPIAAGAASR